MNYIQQTWKIEDDVTEWRETFKILNTEKDFFLLVILFILSQNWTRFDRVRESNCIFNIFSVNLLLSHPPLSFKSPLPVAFPLLIDGIIGYLRTENLKNHTLFRGTYLYSPYMGVPPPPPGHIQMKATEQQFPVGLFAVQLGSSLFIYLFIYLIAFTMITILK